MQLKVKKLVYFPRIHIHCCLTKQHKVKYQTNISVLNNHMTILQRNFFPKQYLPIPRVLWHIIITL